MSSEVAQLRAQIEAEIEAMKLAMDGPRIAAPHAIIAARFSSLENHTSQLAEHMGHEKAVEVVCETYTRLIK